MFNDVPEVVTLTIRVDEVAQGLFIRLLMEAAKQSGLPLSDQFKFAIAMIFSGWRLAWDGKDQSPADDLTIKNYEVTARKNQGFNMKLSDHFIDELKQRQLYYQLNGGILGSNREVSYDETIVIDLNIVYDPSLITDNLPEQDKLEYIKQNLTPKLRYWTKTLSKINLDYTIRYNVGKCDSNRVDIISGRIVGMANIFYLNDSKTVKPYAKTEPYARNIFFSEFIKDLMYDRTLCHELCHLFGITGLTGNDTVDTVTSFFYIPNIISDVRINNALAQLEDDAVKKGFQWSRFKEESANEKAPSIFDIFRYGARRLKTEK